MASSGNLPQKFARVTIYNLGRGPTQAGKGEDFYIPMEPGTKLLFVDMRSTGEVIAATGKGVQDDEASD